MRLPAKPFSRSHCLSYAGGPAFAGGRCLHSSAPNECDALLERPRHRGAPLGRSSHRGTCLVQVGHQAPGARIGLLGQGELASYIITLDTSGLFAALNRRDPAHQQVKATLLGNAGPFLIPAGILAEITYLIERTLAPNVLDAFLSDLESGGYTLDCGEKDIPRIRALVQRYADFPLGFADAAVVACAERLGGRILTLDLRHFGAAAREGTITLLPE